MYNINRRTALKGIAGLAGAGAVGGAGLSLSSGGAFASATAISSNDVTVSNDRGELHKVTIDPTFQLDWGGFDEAVAKIMMVVEADTGEGWTPIFRMTPWLDPGGQSGSGVYSTGPGTSGHFHVNVPLSQVLSQDSRYTGASPPRTVPRPLEVMNLSGRPAYASVSDSTYPAGSEAKYVGGSSLGSASDAETALVQGAGLPLVNNFPVIDAGYYGAAGSSSAFNNGTDGTTGSPQPVSLRYTFALIRANMSYMKFKYNNGTAFNSTQDAAAASGGTFEASDIDSGNSGVVVLGQTSKDYATLQGEASQPSIVVAEADFNVTVDNLQSTLGTPTGNSSTSGQ